MDYSVFLQHGVSNGLLIVIIVYLLRYHIPSLVKAFEEGMRNVAEALKEVTATLRDITDRLSDQRMESAQSAADVQSTVDRCIDCLLYTSPSPRDLSTSRMPSSA